MDTCFSASLDYAGLLTGGQVACYVPHRAVLLIKPKAPTKIKQQDVVVSTSLKRNCILCRLGKRCHGGGLI